MSAEHQLKSAAKWLTDLSSFHEGQNSSSPVFCMAYAEEKAQPLFIVLQDCVNRKILFHRVNAVTWLLWPAVCVWMMKVIHIRNDLLSFFHSSPVEQTSSITAFDVALCVSNSHSVGRNMCHTVCLVSMLQKDSEHSKKVMQPLPFSPCLIVIHARPLQKHICDTALH